MSGSLSRALPHAWSADVESIPHQLARRVFWAFATLHLAVWTIVPLLIQPNPPLDTVEIVAWGREWELGYAKHPPLAAWLAETARLVGGAGGVLWPIYLLGQISVVTAFWAVFRLGLDIGRPIVALASVLVLEATGRYTWMTLELNHNLLVLPFFPLTALSLHRALTRGRLRWWIATGACLGVGILTKYTIILLALAIAALLVVSRDARRRAIGPGPALALVTCVLITLPHVAWLAGTGFPTISYVAERGQGDAGVAGRLLNPLDFLLRQALMLEFLPIALALLLAWPWRLRSLAPGERLARQLLLAAGLGPGLIALLLSVASGVNLRAIWGMPLWSFLGLVVLFCFATRPDGALLRRAAAGCALFLVVNVGLALVEGVAGPYMSGRGFRTHFPGRVLTAHVVEAWRQRFPTPLPLVAGERWLAGNVAFHAPSRPSVLTNGGLGTASLDEEACPWTSVADLKSRGGVVVWLVERQGAALPADLAETLPGAEVLPSLSLPWQTGAHVAPVKVGIAVVPPGSGATPAGNPARGPSQTPR